MAPAPLPVRSVRRSVLASTVAFALAVAPFTVSAAAPDSEVERLYVDGQDKYAEGDFAGAADAWTRLLDRLPEAQANRATRENVLLNVVQAHLDGYARARKDDGTKDISHLRSGKAVLDTYFADFKKAYGDRAAVSAAVQEKADELDRILTDAERDAAATPTATPDPDPDPTDPPPGDGTKSTNIIVLEAENDGGGLIVGGAVAAGLSLGGFGLLIGGGIIANRALEDYEAATTQDGRDEATKSGKLGNALQYTGGIVGGVLLVTGGVLIGLGLKRRKDARAARDEKLRSISVTPVGSRAFTGLTVQGRF